MEIDQERKERFENAGVKFDKAKDLATIDLETLQKAMTESPVLKEEIKRIYTEGVKLNFKNLYDTLLNNEQLFPSFGFDKKQLLYEAFMEFIKENLNNTGAR